MRTSVAVTAAATAAAALAVPVAAQAGTVTLDQPCYVEQTQMRATGTGFTPGSNLTLSGNGALATTVADAAGGFSVPIAVPSNPSMTATSKSIVTYTLKVQDSTNPAQDTEVRYKVTNFAFGTNAGTSSPRAIRSWSFAGFPIGSSIYGHFRHGGTTYANYRFGRAKAPCGTLFKTAPLLPVTTVRRGTWTVQIDTKMTYSKRTKLKIVDKTTVFLRIVPRSARLAVTPLQRLTTIPSTADWAV